MPLSTQRASTKNIVEYYSEKQKRRRRYNNIHRAIVGYYSRTLCEHVRNVIL